MTVRMTTRIRTKLDKIWNDVVAPTLDQQLLKDNVVPDRFLQYHKIRIISHDFKLSDTETTNLSLDPPVLFKPRPPSAVTDYPINPNGYEPGYLIGSDELKFLDFNPPANIENVLHTRWSPSNRGSWLSWYLANWALGRFPRRLPPHVISLGQLYNISPVIAPHPMLTEIFGFSGGYLHGKTWDTDIYEYNMTNAAGQKLFLPHTITISIQSSNGHNGSIIHGELASIVTAMRNRARQPTVWTPEDSDEEAESMTGGNQELPESELRFRTEKRFPVLMVSVVGPQHARIYYACMAGQELIIRQSELYSFEKQDIDLLNYFSCVLLSSPLKEREIVAT
ncbi:hypothetical protein BDW59DRAFT_147628 [Aspergillus cavernicola]|uniref:Uncharacterized protein n=1 Tax=Aspergillus cavernicola TaxID=176166 RepID=A0ABR4I9K7_9EURO